MKLTPSCSLLALALAFTPVTFALDNSAAVKATPLLKTESSWNGKPFVYPEGQAQVSGMLIEIAPGGETGWHSHPVASFAYILEGELEVHLKTGEVNRLTAGDALAEVVDTLHNGRNLGATPVKLVVFYTGVVGQALSVKEGAQ
ncbi:MAG: cupin domain-containing protein [Pseudomonas sp.]|uniref:cupin domain-containing protein n=1 Tax=Pseudomonas sp. TaxID=306 RepID=UPI00339B7CA7